MIDATPGIEREYIEIYPVKWEPLGSVDIARIMKTQSYRGLREITLYLHIPFCPEICSFCSFNKRAFREDIYTAYIAALTEEIRSYKNHPDLDGRVVTAVYFGGGTASTLTPSDLEHLVQTLKEIFPIAPGCEFSVESHPNTLDHEKLARYHASGVNRLSIGIQSFVDRKIQAIGRHNTAAQNEYVIREAKAVGIEKLSIDLMYRLPYETMEELKFDLAKVCEYRPANVSLYSLIVEGTGLEKALPTLPTTQVESEMFSHIYDTLTQHNYEQWSVSDFCQPGGITRYNVNYWRAPQTLLLGMGAGAHTHYFGGYTWTNVYTVTEYIKAITNGCFAGVTGQEVSLKELQHRYMVLGLHCLSVDKAPFKKLFGVELADVFAEGIAAMVARGWLQETADQLQITIPGQTYRNNIAKAFFSQACRGEVQPWSKNLQKVKPSRYVPLLRKKSA
ncbi:MAG TPA: radical SAM family heme chaperone HemW [Ktedonosporobacter sp.]|jgi:oxygen-independent coproporphyrinogen-3 oxidase|nr:radical SAM family heme chaperone HemW [Ktedonosporobacter sp.]